MEIVNNCSYGVNTQRQISETGRESEIVEYHSRASVDGGEYENVVYNFTNIPIEQNHAYNVHSTGRLDEVSESGQYELVIPTESATNVIVQQNQAYNIITTQPATDGSYDDISKNTTEQFYEEIIEQQNHLTQVPGKVATPVPPLKATCSFWQDKAKVAVRITILMLVSLLLALFISSDGLVFTATVIEYSSLPPLTLIIGTIFLTLLLLGVIMEIAHLYIRTCRRRTTKCFLAWDIIYSCVTIFFSLVFLGASIGLTVLWSTINHLVEGYIFLIIITVLCFTLAVLYLFRACWIIAIIKIK
ncbi:uncharacterized protein LOC135348569 isoform X2 [Halichondria panicea]|uniref:uncharacterized protein LOC135348569 isoform X2 n=1 Tax=Halichondria panicea TaxID=6063 RepID=UPI00312B66A3